MVEYETSRFCSSIDTFLYTMIGCTASVVDDADFAEKDTTEISQLTTTATPIEEICTVDESGVNDEFEPVKAATPKEYLALYGEDQIVTEYFQCAPLENVIYVNKGTGILIYENGIEIGWMSQYELMEPYNARESFDYDVFDHFSGSTTSGEFVKDQIKQNKCGEDYRVSYYTVRRGAYTYGDTEWLVEQGIFRTIEEALKEAYYGHRVYIS